jgi:hypothetical protein
MAPLGSTRAAASRAKASRDLGRLRPPAGQGELGLEEGQKRQSRSAPGGARFHRRSRKGRMGGHRMGERRLALAMRMQQEARVPQEPQEPSGRQLRRPAGPGARPEARGPFADPVLREPPRSRLPQGREVVEPFHGMEHPRLGPLGCQVPEHRARRLHDLTADPEPPAQEPLAPAGVTCNPRLGPVRGSCGTSAGGAPRGPALGDLRRAKLPSDPLSLVHHRARP